MSPLSGNSESCRDFRASSAVLPPAPNDDRLPRHATAVVDVIPCVAAPAEPFQLGPYSVKREIGRGAMGAVYEATHERLKRQVALKLLPEAITGTASQLARFQREMEAVGRLDHPNIVRATDAGEFNGIHYLAMERIIGVDLGKLLLQLHHLDCAAACELVRQTACGLQHIYENDLVHRDIKPSNLLLSVDGVVKILDLGIAMLRQPEAASGATSAHSLLGTPDYMAPEQVHSTCDVDIRADIYSLGCTLYTLLSGKTPFHGEAYTTRMAKLVAQSRDTPPPIASLVPTLPPDLVRVVERMMTKEPSGRYQTPREVATALAPWADGARLRELVAQEIDTDDRQRQVDRDLSAARSEGTLRLPSRQRPTQRWRRAWIGGGSLIAVGLLCAVLGKSSPTRLESEQNTLPVARYGTPLPGSGASDLAAATMETSPRQLPDGGAAALPAGSSPQAMSEDTRQIREDTSQLVRAGKGIRRNTQRIADTLEELRASFQSAAQQGGLVLQPQTAGQFYHNARLCEQQGQYLAARGWYLRVLQSGQEFVDVHLRFQQLLKLQEGPAGARQIYQQLPGDRQNSVRVWAEALLEELPSRETRLRSLAASAPGFAPAAYELSRCVSEAFVGPQSLTDKAQEKEWLETFFRWHDEGQFLSYFLDQAAAASMMEDARQRLTALQTLDADPLAHPVRLNTSRHRHGWNLVFQIAEPAREIAYRLRPTDPFQSTGFTHQVDPQSGQPVPQMIVAIPDLAESTQIEVQYTDVRGQLRGPYSLPFEPTRELIRDARRKLDLTRSFWVRWGGPRHPHRWYFTHLAAYREAIDEVRYAIESNTPRQQFNLPDLAAGSAGRLFVDVAPDSEWGVVQVTFRDGTKTDIVRIERPTSRQGTARK